MRHMSMRYSKGMMAHCITQLGKLGNNVFPVESHIWMFSICDFMLEPSLNPMLSVEILLIMLFALLATRLIRSPLTALSHDGWLKIPLALTQYGSVTVLLVQKLSTTNWYCLSAGKSHEKLTLQLFGDPEPDALNNVTQLIVAGEFLPHDPFHWLSLWYI